MKWKTANPLDYELLKENAKRNRAQATEAESVFWQQVKNSALGEKCRRQYIIGDYLVDFFFRKSMLIIEIDGAYHFTPAQKEQDAIRQQWLQQSGYKVLRFTNEQVLFELTTVLQSIKLNLDK